MSKIKLEYIPGRDRNFSWGRKDEEYMADFILVSRRTLDELEYRIFSSHFLLGADWNLCCRRLNIDRGTFFHAVYRIEQKLGRVFRELEPYGLFPLDEYFRGTVRVMPDAHPREPAPERIGPVRIERRLRPLLRQSA
jgi:hypothetical protein